MLCFFKRFITLVTPSLYAIYVVFFLSLSLSVLSWFDPPGPLEGSEPAKNARILFQLDSRIFERCIKSARTDGNQTQTHLNVWIFWP